VALEREKLAAETHKLTVEARELEAQTEKTRAEARKVRDENSFVSRSFSVGTPLLTALIAVLGLGFTAQKAARDRREQRAADAQARDAATTKRFDERFADATRGLASENPADKLAGAVLMSSMVRERRAELSHQALSLLLASLQVEHDEVTTRLLVRAFERAVRAAPQRLIATDEGGRIISLSHVRAPELNLASLDATGLDVAFAHLDGADFRRTVLRGSKGYDVSVEQATLERADLRGIEWVHVHARGAKLQRAQMSGAKLGFADLSGADFYRADVQDAEFPEANLSGAKFHRATVARAKFQRATFDDRSLRTIVQARDWREAEFDEVVREQLEALDPEAQPPPSPPAH
jgi:uncharacterized protein YjbI with pentapeptide repeats